MGGGERQGGPLESHLSDLTSFSSGPCFDSGTKIMIRDSAVRYRYRTTQEPDCDMRLAWVDVNRKSARC